MLVHAQDTHISVRGRKPSIYVFVNFRELSGTPGKTIKLGQTQTCGLGLLLSQMFFTFFFWKNKEDICIVVFFLYSKLKYVSYITLRRYI